MKGILSRLASNQIKAGIIIEIIMCKDRGVVASIVNSSLIILLVTITP